MPTRAKEKEHFKSIEEYLLDRGWVEKQARWAQVRWVDPITGQPYTCLYTALRSQLERDCDIDEGGWRVTGITLEKR